MLRVPESWLRRRTARRPVPCTFLGRHSRFSSADLDQDRGGRRSFARHRPAPGSRRQQAAASARAAPSGASPAETAFAAQRDVCRRVNTFVLRSFGYGAWM